MKEITFVGIVFVDDDHFEGDAEGWVEHALERGDKHASYHSASLGRVVSVETSADPT